MVVYLYIPNSINSLHNYTMHHATDITTWVITAYAGGSATIQQYLWLPRGCAACCSVQVQPLSAVYTMQVEEVEQMGPRRAWDISTPLMQVSWIRKKSCQYLNVFSDKSWSIFISQVAILSCGCIASYVYSSAWSISLFSRIQAHWCMLSSSCSGHKSTLLCLSSTSMHAFCILYPGQQHIASYS